MAESFDEQELLERVDHDLAFLAETVQMLADDGQALLQQLQAALAAGDAAGAGRAAHTLKGMVANFCAPGVQTLALAIEHAGKAGDCAAAATATAAFEPALDVLLGELELFVGARP